LPSIRLTPEKTVSIMLPMPEVDGVFEDLSEVELAVLAGLTCLGPALVGSWSEVVAAWSEWAGPAGCVLLVESLLVGSLVSPSHRPTVLKAVPTGPELSDDAAWLLADPLDELELDPLLDWCLLGVGATALPGELSEPPPGPLPGPPAAAHVECRGVVWAARCTVVADAEAVIDGRGVGLVAVLAGVSQAPARQIIAAPPDTAAGLTRAMIDLVTMMHTPFVRGI
jgi:hypothetical protein